MSDPLLYTDLAQMPQPVVGAFGKRRWRLWALATELGIIALAAALMYWPILKVSNVVYRGPADWQSEVTALAGVPSSGNILHFDPADAASRITAQYSRRADVEVMISLPGTITIRMTPHVPQLWTEGEIGITADGHLLPEPMTRPEAPLWRPGIDWTENRTLAERAHFAAGFWNEVASSDTRFGAVTSDFTMDPEFGWMITAADGKTRIALGDRSISARAGSVARLLDQNDTLLTEPCFIDARFDGQLLWRGIPKSEPDSTTVDSTSTVVAAEPLVSPKPSTQTTRRTAKGRA